MTIDTEFKFKPSPGAWSIIEYSTGLQVNSGDGKIITKIYEGYPGSWQEHESNARLMAEAGTVYNESKMTPKQLLEKVKLYQKTIDELQSTFEKVRGVISKETDNG